MKRILCLILIIFVLSSLVPAASAYDVDRKCSIEVLVKYDGTYVDGGKLKAVKVGYVDPTEWVFRQITNDKIITDIGESKAVNAMVTYYNANKATLKPVTIEVEDGFALFENLSVGLYLIFQEDAASGYNNLAPFLVTLPYALDDKGSYDYDVTVTSKSELKREAKTPTTPSKPTYGNKLPQTGQLTWPIPWMASSGMVLFAFGWWLCFGRRKDSYED